MEIHNGGTTQRIKMVYTPALVFGPATGNNMCKEDGVIELLRKFVSQMTSSEGRSQRNLEKKEDMLIERKQSLYSDMYMDYEEEILQQAMSQEIQRCLSDAKGSSLGCELLLLPRPLIDKVARDVVRTSVREPCGLRGASIQVYLDKKDTLLLLGDISFSDPSIPPTFELSIVLKADNGWPPLKHIFATVKLLRLRPEYRLIKRKLYSSECPVIHDFYGE